MTLRSKFILFAVLAHLLMGVLAWYLLQQNKYLFIGMKLLILFSVFVTAQLYTSFFKLLQLIRSGIESIKDKDFSTTFTAVGQKDLVNVYNRMISQLRRERVAQAEKHFLLDKLIQASSAGIILLGFDNQVESINPAAERFLGKQLTELQGKHISPLPEAWSLQLKDLPTGQSVTFRIHGTWTYRCHRAHFLDRGFQHYFILIEELTEAILQNERQAYEKVIRVMSHEVNNTTGAINSILGSLQHYSSQLLPDDQADYAHVLQVATNRNSNLSRFMAGFADVVRLPKPKKALINLNEILQNLYRLLHPELQKRSVSCSLQLSSEPLTIPADPYQIEQVLLNVLKNAIESIDQNGQIVIRTQLKPAILTITETGREYRRTYALYCLRPFLAPKTMGKALA